MITTFHAGVVLPASVLSSPWFSILATFVAVNTVVYLALAIAKLLPKLHPEDWLRRDRYRTETRSIYPDGPVGPRGAKHAAQQSTTDPAQRAER